MPADSIKRMDSSNGSNGSRNGVTSDGNNGNDNGHPISSSPGTSSLRERTDSENSEKSARFVLPSVDGSPPQVLTADEVVNVVNNIQKMEIVHEIALNPDFKLQPYEPPENSLEKRIKEIMHKAFWDVLKEQLSRDPPCFDHAIQLLNEIKEMFPKLISAYNRRTLDHINEVLDTTVIKQQAEMGVLNFRSYADFIIQILAKSCAPIRDEQIQELTKIDDVVDTFKGILEIMSLMKLDMANCLLEFAKNDLLANSAEYEKEKFKEYLKYYKFGFPATESWLKRNKVQQDIHTAAATTTITNDAAINNASSTIGVSSTTSINIPKVALNETICNAYIELIDWDCSNEFPEMLSIDKERLLKLGNRFYRLYIMASIMAICSGISIISRKSDLRNTLVEQIQILLQNINTEQELKESLESIWLQIRKLLTEELSKTDTGGIGNNQENITGLENTVKKQILQLENKESPVRKLMYERLKSYLKLVFRSKLNLLPPPPSGYIDFKDELENIIMIFRRIINYNYTVFGEYYVKILNGEMIIDNTNSDNDNNDGTVGTIDDTDKTGIENQQK